MNQIRLLSSEKRVWFVRYDIDLTNYSAQCTINTPVNTPTIFLVYSSKYYPSKKYETNFTNPLPSQRRKSTFPVLKAQNIKMNPRRFTTPVRNVLTIVHSLNETIRRDWLLVVNAKLDTRNTAITVQIETKIRHEIYIRPDFVLSSSGSRGSPDELDITCLFWRNQYSR